jgi:DNA-binding transcriptional regulator YdaS (Cro superfamily)
MLSTCGMNDSPTDSIPEATARAKAAAGGPSALARALSESGPSISPQAISLWAQVPAERVLEVERLTGVSRYELRPDVYGPAPRETDDQQTGAAA